jgi:hypothetical protein
MRHSLLIALAGLLAACVSHEIRTVDMTPPAQIDTPQTEQELLDIGVAVFDPNVPEDFDEQVATLVQPEIRRAEANFIPYFAKNLLQSTGNWGAVRVVPRPTNAVDVNVAGKIIESNGETLTIEATVSDARGVTWFAREYHALASKYAYEDGIPADIDPFQAIYKRLADDMLEYRTALSRDEIAAIRATAEMKFAREFSPDAFATHVTRTEDGGFALNRLPAEDDPMLARVRKVREREYLFIDTLDEYYSGFYRSMYGPYQNWRSSSYSEAIAYRELRAQARARTMAGVGALVGGVAAIYESNDAYVDASGIVSVMSGAALIKSAIMRRNEAEMHAQVLQELAVSSEAEIVPHTIELENQTVRLQGTVDQQYEDLRRILRKFYFEDLGLAPPDQPAPKEPDDDVSG